MDELFMTSKNEIVVKDVLFWVENFVSDMKTGVALTAALHSGVHFGTSGGIEGWHCACEKSEVILEERWDVVVRKVMHAFTTKSS